MEDAQPGYVESRFERLGGVVAILAMDKFFDIVADSFMAAERFADHLIRVTLVGPDSSVGQYGCTGEFICGLIPGRGKAPRFPLDFRLRFCYSHPPKKTRGGGRYQLKMETKGLRFRVSPLY